MLPGRVITPSTDADFYSAAGQGEGREKERCNTESVDPITLKGAKKDEAVFPSAANIHIRTAFVNMEMARHSDRRNAGVNHGESGR